MKTSFFKRFISFTLISALVRTLLEITTGGEIRKLLTLQQAINLIIAGLIVTGLTPYLVKKHQEQTK